MKDNKMILFDRMNFKDEILHRSGIYARTEVIGGYGLREINGISSLKETVFSDCNMIPIGGAQYSFEQLFGIPGTLDVPTLYEISGGVIGLPNKAITEYELESETVRYYVPAENGVANYKYIPHPIGETICLFGVGITGSATNVMTKPDVNYLESSIQESLAIENGSTMSGIMVPFRYTASEMSETNAAKYFGKTGTWYADTTEPIGYYLKRFETEPAIKNFWKASSDETEATNPVSQNEYYPRGSGGNTSPISSYVEMILKVSTNDLKEWFQANENIDSTRINTLALYTGRYNATQGDYENVRMFSKLTFNVTNLSTDHDFTLIYRIYAS